MRFKVVLEGGGGKEIWISSDYRRRFISFLKDVFQAADDSIFNHLYSDTKKRKPFTFSVYLGKTFRAEKEKVLTFPPYEFLFSSGDPAISTHFYNGVLKLRSKKYLLDMSSISDSPFYINIKEISLAIEDIIESESVLFKTKQPVVLTHPRKKRNHDGYYLTPLDEEWEKILRTRLSEDYQRVTGNNVDTERIRFLEVSNPLALEVLVRWRKLDRSFLDKPIKITKIKHYGGYLTGFKGIFLLCGPVELMQFVYQYGMGIRTGQGFGMLDVLAQLKEEICRKEKKN
ncbi:MAG: CRISPR-associated endoribonuclease Cas6 [Candidatus Aminicenantes bacterium]|nr:CRISPR-associated endoribonuclease Cas6 [Candidatus Aminicenantes bacterium]